MQSAKRPDRSSCTMFDDEELAIAARHQALASLVRSLDGDFGALDLDATTLDDAAEYVLGGDPEATAVADVIRTDSGKGFLYHAHEHVERHARNALGVLSAGVPLKDPRCLSADRTARLVESKLESLLWRWLTDERVGYEHFLWTLCITGDSSKFIAVDQDKSRAVATALGIPEPPQIDRARICAARTRVWQWSLGALDGLSVAELSHSRWRVRDRPNGDDWSDWFAAERAKAMLQDHAGAAGSGHLDPWTI